MNRPQNQPNRHNQRTQERLILAVLHKRGIMTMEELRSHRNLNSQGLDRSLVRLAVQGYIDWTGEWVKLTALPMDFTLICSGLDSVFTSETTLMSDILVDHYLTMCDDHLSEAEEMQLPVVYPRDVHAGSFAPTTLSMWQMVRGELLDFGLEEFFDSTLLDGDDDDSTPGPSGVMA